MSSPKIIIVRVRGYFRKDGTWVSPHIRRIGRKKTSIQLTFPFSNLN